MNYTVDLNMCDNPLSKFKLASVCHAYKFHTAWIISSQYSVFFIQIYVTTIGGGITFLCFSFSDGY